MEDCTLLIRDHNMNVMSKLSFEKGESLLLLCKKAGIDLDTSCNGKGTCGRCKVHFVNGAPLPELTERLKLSPEELRAGFRLACMTKLTEECEIVLSEEIKPDVVTGKFDVRWNVASLQKSDNTKCKTGVPDMKECPHFLVADIGTTTLVIEKRRKCDGSVVDTYKAINAQRVYGADVLSRMEAAMEGKAEDLAEMIRSQLAEGIKQLCGKGQKANDQEEGVEKIDFMVIAANTAMIHLLMGYPVERLARAPFCPENPDEVITEIAGIKTYIMPGISAFVGADIVAGLMAVEYVEKLSALEKADSTAETEKKSNFKLFIDLGTNAELVLYDDRGGLCTATAAGPAFEGDAGTGFFGSDMVAVLAQLYKKGIIDKNGTLDDAHFEHGVSIPCGDREMHISQQQIRNLQLAKAAVRAGIEVLIQRTGIITDQIEKVYLAGGFGYYLDVHAAAAIGLIPAALEEKTVACGNTALSGAAVYAGRILKNAERRMTLSLDPINLAEEEIFEKSYVNHMNF